jgi:HPt (histidine-containing phosphotransfer) domain-containing protein
MSVDIPKEARQKYIERRRLDLENCKKALEQRDFEVLARVGHQIKGNASTFGYEELGEIAISMEEQALAKNSEKLSQVLAQFSKFLSQP